MMKYLIIHGYGSTPENSTSVNVFKEIISTYDENAEIITPTYDVNDIKASTSRIVDMADDHTVVIGISLGGFIARYVAMMCNAYKLILVNPSIHAYENLKKYDELSDRVCDSFKELFVVDDNPTIGILVMLAMNDDVVDPYVTYEKYKDRALVVLSDGGHRMTTLPTLYPHIEKFLNTVCG